MVDRMAVVSSLLMLVALFCGGLIPACGAERSRKLLQGPVLAVRDYSTHPNDILVWCSDDKSSGACTDVSLFRPKASSYYLGFTPLIGYTGTLPDPYRATTVDVLVPGQMGDPDYPIAMPDAWDHVWGMTDGPGFSIWCPKPPAGYTAMGCMFRRDEHGTMPPSAQEVGGLVVVRSDLITPAADVTCIWSSGCSGSQDTGSIWIPTEGPDGFSPGTMWVTPSYDPPTDAMVLKSSMVQVLPA